MTNITIRQQFEKDKERLNPNFKPQTNVPTKIVNVKKMAAMVQKNEDTDSEYAINKMKIEIEYEGELVEKNWELSSSKLIDKLDEMGILKEVGSSFTVEKTGEGFKTNYKITDVQLPTSKK